MRNATPALLVLLAGCGGSSVSLEGTLADTAAATEAWVAGSDAPVPIAGGAFRLDDVPRDSAVIGFARGDADTAWMRLGPVRSGGTLRMGAIRLSDGLAFPASVEGADEPVAVNGVRIGAPDAVPGELNVPATVLAVSEDGDALIVRPTEGALPDLSVVLTPQTVVHTVDGDPVDAGRLEFGDSLRVSGVGQGAYVIASEVTVPRRVASAGNAGGERVGDDDEDADDEEAGGAEQPGGTPRVAGGAGTDDGEAKEERAGILQRILRRGGDERESKGKGEERGKGKGKGRD